ncbi:MAG: hypothetical protein V7750_19400, partial [Sneathiella sp.]
AGSTNEQSYVVDFNSARNCRSLQIQLMPALVTQTRHLETAQDKFNEFHANEISVHNRKPTPSLMYENYAELCSTVFCRGVPSRHDNVIPPLRIRGSQRRKKDNAGILAQLCDHFRSQLRLSLA